MNALENYYFSDTDNSCYSNQLIVAKLWELTIQLFLFNAKFSTIEIVFWAILSQVWVWGSVQALSTDIGSKQYLFSSDVW